MPEFWPNFGEIEGIVPEKSVNFCGQGGRTPCGLHSVNTGIPMLVESCFFTTEFLLTNFREKWVFISFFLYCKIMSHCPSEIGTN